PMHATDPRDDAVGLAETLDEARHDDDPRATALEEVRGLVEPFGSKKDVAPVALDERPPAEVTDRKADVVAYHRAEEAEQTHQPDLQAAGARVDGAEDQDGLARDRYAEVLQQHETGDREVAVLIEYGPERVQEARQMHRVAAHRSSASRVRARRRSCAHGSPSRHSAAVRV